MPGEKLAIDFARVTLLYPCLCPRACYSSERLTGAPIIVAATAKTEMKPKAESSIPLSCGLAEVDLLNNLFTAKPKVNPARRRTEVIELVPIVAKPLPKLMPYTCSTLTLPSRHLRNFSFARKISTRR
jgi:hypothetical protein